ncbi:F0F1 ATP synthase subunit delta [Aliagarivorans taiwanensis]|uniref:F0F1 ATP synthase subunit delta n=1 Tax=Aliagarivorans taiwanensis TaxID=561966 RepID=UPI0004087ACF|nr:F0F1 ATP synthase subunit delta [Aliagarivorans taiwanensis]
MAEINTIARPYAKAAFDYAVEKQAIEEWTGMLAVAAEIADNEQVTKQLQRVLPDAAISLFSAVGDGYFDEKFTNFLKVMAENQRLSALPAVLALYAELKAEYAKVVTAEVVSAEELSEQQRAQISESLEQRLARKIELVCSVDPTLIAGVIIRAGDMVIDRSIRGQLRRLSDTLQA